MAQQPIIQPPPMVRPEEQLSVSGDVHRAFRYAMIVGVPLAIGGVVVALLASLALSIPAYVYLVMGVSIVLLSLALIITSYSWFRSLRVIENEMNKLSQRIATLQQVRPPVQTQPRMPAPSPMQQRYVMPPPMPPYMPPPQQQGSSSGTTSDNEDYTQ